MSRWVINSFVKMKQSKLTAYGSQMMLYEVHLRNCPRTYLLLLFAGNNFIVINMESSIRQWTLFASAQIPDVKAHRQKKRALRYWIVNVFLNVISFLSFSTSPCVFSFSSLFILLFFLDKINNNMTSFDIFYMPVDPWKFLFSFFIFLYFFFVFVCLFVNWHKNKVKMEIFYSYSWW